MYKLIALDMDGTLLNSEKKVSAKTKEALKYAIDKGVRVVIATGRPIDGVERYLEELNLISEDDYVLSFNGALVRNAKTKEAISKDAIKGADYKYLYEISKDLGVNIHAFSLYGCHTPKMSKYSEVEARLNQINIAIKAIEEVDSEEPIIKVMMVDEPEVLERAVKGLPKEVYDRYTVVRSTPYFLEFLSKSCNKGEGLRKLAEYLNIKQEEIIACGDAENDHHMIEYAGLGVAMGNGTEETKKIANYITKSNNEDGIAHVIYKFIK